MGELGLNKILGALLATALALFGLNALTTYVFRDKAPHGSDHGAGHGDDHGEPKTLAETMCANFAYCLPESEVLTASIGGPVEAEAVFDLGAALTSADLAKGERLFKGQCVTCHTIEAGGSNGTGPNLHNVVGAPKAKHAGFNYSAALTGLGSAWSYENLDAWIKNPGAYAKGTSMSFAGIRKDADRAAVIAYLAKNTTAPPAFPAPLAAAAPAEGATPPAEGAAVPGETPAVPTAPVPAEPAPAEPVPT